MFKNRSLNIEKKTLRKSHGSFVLIPFVNVVKTLVLLPIGQALLKNNSLEQSSKGGTSL